MPEPGADLLLSEDCHAFYLAVLGNGGTVRAADLDQADEASLAVLLDLGLVVPRVEDAGYAAVNPRAAIGRLAAGMRAASSRLLADADESSRWLAELAAAYDAAPHRVYRSGRFLHTEGFGSIRHRLAQLDAECETELLAAQPGGARPAEGLPDALARLRRLADGGGTARGLYEPGAETDRATSEFAAAATEIGCRYRVLGESFQRVLIYDRRVAVIPASDDNSSAAFIEDPAVVAFLVESFERDWQRADRVRWKAHVPDAEPGREPRTQVARLLAQGLTQRTVASRLGLSERTVAGHIARLRELHDAETLFQLGWQMRGARDA
ncbi:LuxR C-terminal-related transcriptional regulator [Kitasatospora sp. NBC_00458]|uniref:LuxR C-terminal-related transcriptional regulator n=1 Tax=Kitasatospora sp. NBC_00458 TaxID=2903568 RepID=UPI002E17F017